MIYFVQPVDGGPIKIGTTVNVDVRRKQLEATYGRPLVVLATMKGGRKREAEIHDQFVHLRLGRTEQFKPDPELLAFIGRPLFASAGEVVEMPYSGRTMPIASLKGKQAFAEWFERLITHCRLSGSAALEHGLIELAKAKGFTEPPPER